MADLDVDGVTAEAVAVSRSTSLLASTMYVDPVQRHDFFADFHRSDVTGSVAVMRSSNTAAASATPSSPLRASTVYVAPDLRRRLFTYFPNRDAAVSAAVVGNAPAIAQVPKADARDAVTAAYVLAFSYS